MAGKVKLDSREARSKLKPRGAPYWQAIERGVNVGFRRLKGKAGTWWERHYLGNQRCSPAEFPGVADDLNDADDKILDWWQAGAKARESHEGKGARRGGPADGQG